MSSPNFPGSYKNSDQQIYNISVAENKVIRIEFSQMNIEYTKTCDRDYITIVDGDGTKLLPRSCGSNKLPPVTTSYTNRAKVIFHTDKHYAYKGWKLTWKEGNWICFFFFTSLLQRPDHPEESYFHQINLTTTKTTLIRLTGFK